MAASVLLPENWFDLAKMLGNMPPTAQDVVLLTIHLYI
jgi:hypothetical protein